MFKATVRGQKNVLKLRNGKLMGTSAKFFIYVIKICASWVIKTSVRWIISGLGNKSGNAD